MSRVISKAEFLDFLEYQPSSMHGLIEVECNNEVIEIPRKFNCSNTSFGFYNCKSIKIGKDAHMMIKHITNEDNLKMSIENYGEVYFLQDVFLKSIFKLINYGDMVIGSRRIDTHIEMFVNRGKLYFEHSAICRGNTMDNHGVFIMCGINMSNQKIGCTELSVLEFEKFANTGKMLAYSNLDNLSKSVINKGTQIVVGRLYFANQEFRNLLGQIKSYSGITILVKKTFVNGSKGKDVMRDIEQNIYVEKKVRVNHDLPKHGKFGSSYHWENTFTPVIVETDDINASFYVPVFGPMPGTDYNYQNYGYCSDCKVLKRNSFLWKEQMGIMSVRFEDYEVELVEETTKLGGVHFSGREEDSGTIVSMGTIDINARCEIDNTFGKIVSRKQLSIDTRFDIINSCGVIASEDSIYINGLKLKNHQIDFSFESKNPDDKKIGNINGHFNFHKATHFTTDDQVVRFNFPYAETYYEMSTALGHWGFRRLMKTIPIGNKVLGFGDIQYHYGNNGLIVCANPNGNGKIELDCKEIDAGRLICSNGKIENVGDAPIQTIEGGGIECKYADLGQRNQDIHKLFIIASDVDMKVSEFKNAVQRDFGGEFDLSELVEVFELLDN